MPQFHIGWSGKGGEGYECSSKGDRRFSALYARMPDGRTIEEWYQCDIKGYDLGGTDWKKGKGQPPRFAYPGDQLWQFYLNLWRIWAIRNSTLLPELLEHAREKGGMLRDSFTSNSPSSINQARALAQILNEWII